MEQTRISIREWQKQYKDGAFNSKERSVQVSAGWYDWFCRDDALLGRLKKLAPVIMGITEPYILDNYYLWLKNNCPLNGTLYDDVRFEPLTGERDGKYFLVSLDSPHENGRWSLTTERFGFDAPEFECDRAKEMAKYIDQLGRELKDGITPAHITERKNGKLYIAYGSNLNLRQMKHRCPTATVAGKAVLKGWKMTFRGAGGGVATIEREDDSSVPVLVWRIYPQDEKALDAYEGAPRFYRKETLPVELDGETVEAMVYIMNDGHPICYPGTSYYDTILEGYETAGFDTNVLQVYAEACKGTLAKTDVIRKQIIAIRDSGETNMFDVYTVQRIANREGYYELARYIGEHRKEYVHFIFTGEFGGEAE